MRSADHGMPVGEPTDPAGARTLDEVTERLRSLRDWARLPLREVAERVAELRRQRGVADDHRVRPSYGAVHALFQSDRKRLNEALLLDIVRVLLDCQAPQPTWREDRVRQWRDSYRAAIRQPVREAHGPGVPAGPAAHLLPDPGRRR